MNCKKYILYFCLCLPLIASSQLFKKDSLKEHQKESKKVKKLLIPTITYNSSFKFMLGFMAAGFYNINKTDTISPVSSSSFIGGYSTNGTWYIVQPNKFYFKEDKYRSKAVTGLASINFQTYLDWGNLAPDIPVGIIPILPDEGVFIDYNTQFQFAYVDFMVNVYKRLYVGANIVLSHSNTTFELANEPSDEQTLFGFGLSSEYDIRNDQMQPLTGFNAKLSTTSFLENLGSTSDYTNINFEYNKYFQQGERNTLLLRLYGQAAIGDVPFAGQNIVGRDDLRGYSEGKYRGNQVYDIQSEYRHWFSEKWGYVAFGGVATAIDNANDLSFDNLLPAVGGGIRFLAIPSKNISIGMDIAVGKDDWGLYFRIGEAFTR